MGQGPWAGEGVVEGLCALTSRRLGHAWHPLLRRPHRGLPRRRCALRHHHRRLSRRRPHRGLPRRRPLRHHHRRALRRRTAGRLHAHHALRRWPHALLLRRHALLRRWHALLRRPHRWRAWRRARRCALTRHHHRRLPGHALRRHALWRATRRRTLRRHARPWASRRLHRHAWHHARRRRSSSRWRLHRRASSLCAQGGSWRGQKPPHPDACLARRVRCFPSRPQ